MHAHAAVGSIDVEEARAMPGVHAVLTMADLAAVTGMERMPLGASPNKAAGPITPYILSNKEVAFVGEAVAMVVAESRYVAEDAAACVVVDYEPLPAVTDIRAAVLDNGVTVRREANSNVLNRHQGRLWRRRLGFRCRRSCLSRRSVATSRLRSSDGDTRCRRRMPARWCFEPLVVDANAQ